MKLWDTKNEFTILTKRASQLIDDAITYGGCDRPTNVVPVLSSMPMASAEEHDISV